MTSQDLVILTGRVAGVPQRHTCPDGSPVLQFPLRMSDPGERPPITIVAIGKLAETEPDLLQSGQVLTVKGRLKQRRWQTPEGRRRSRLEIIATDFQRLEDSHLNPVTHKRGEDDNDHEKTI